MKFKPELSDAIIALVGDCDFATNGKEIVFWKEGNPTQPSAEDLATKLAELTTAWETYQEARKKEYPSIEEQLDDIYHNGLDGWKATIKVTKDKYPKA